MKGEEFSVQICQGIM